MDIESNETPVCLVKKDNCQEVKSIEIDESEPKDKKLELTMTKHEENEEVCERVKNCENTDESVGQDSFKKPVLLIGPRRGKPGQLRPVSCTISKEISEQSHIGGETIVDEDGIVKSTEITKVSIGDKQQIPLQYKEPSWGGLPKAHYNIEVLKSGVILETIDIGKKSFHIVGRLPACDISLAHPTISRYHAILQYRDSEEDKHPSGFYLYDLDSTHGTFWNGCRVRPNTYVRLQGGHMIRFGCSQRKFILQTPPEDMEEESELSVTELKEKRRLQLLEREQQAREEQERAEEAERLRLEKEEREGIDWGMGEDADEDTDMTENPYALTNNEELFLDDPKKTLRGWFEREGQELQYQTEEKGIGQFLCWVDLPIDGVGGRTVRAEAIVKGKKKESVIQCALEACRILDRHGVLRRATHEARKRKTRNWEEEDFYDSDEDNFLDRTGTVEKKREQRMRQAGKLEEKVETYASLMEKHSAITEKIVGIESELKKTQILKDGNTDASNEDALDAFMSSLNSSVFNKADVTKMKLEVQNLRKEEERLLKLVNITRPANLPSLTSPKISEDVPKSIDVKHDTNLSNKRFIDHTGRVVKKSSITANKSISEIEIMAAVDCTTKASTNESRTSVDFNEMKIPIEKQTKSVESSIVEISRDEESDIVNTEASITKSIEETEKSDSEIVKKKKRNIKRMQQRAEKAAKGSEKGYAEETYSEDYSTWLPPQNQSGDGKTNLNDKYGY